MSRTSRTILAMLLLPIAALASMLIAVGVPAAYAVNAPLVTYHAEPGAFDDSSVTKTQPVTATTPTIIMDEKPSVQETTRKLSVSYDANGGTCEGGEALLKKEAQFTEGGNFAFWEDKTTSPATRYNPGDSYSQYDNLDLYASYEPYTKADSHLMPNATREGFSLDGWYTQAEGGQKVGVPGDEVKENTFADITGEEITVYAHWSPVRLEVTFVYMDSPTSMKDTVKYVDYGADAIAPSIPTVTGYTFTGWDRDFTHVTENITVKALYAEGFVCKAVFDGNGAMGKNDPEYIVFKKGESITMPKCTLSRDGLDFQGWSTGRSEGTRWQPGDVVADPASFIIGNGDTVIFYADWGRITVVAGGNEPTGSKTKTDAPQISNTSDGSTFAIAGAAAAFIALAGGFYVLRRAGRK